MSLLLLSFHFSTNYPVNFGAKSPQDCINYISLTNGSCSHFVLIKVPTLACCSVHMFAKIKPKGCNQYITLYNHKLLMYFPSRLSAGEL